jgi:hypothetical protein
MPSIAEIDPEAMLKDPKFQTAGFYELLQKLSKNLDPDGEIRRKKAAEKSNSIQSLETRLRRSLATDIFPVPPCKKPERRERCKTSYKSFCEEYFTEKFDLKWSSEHLDLIESMQGSIHDNEGMLSYAFPRGSGKSTLSEILCIWALFYDYRKFVVLISADGKASLEAFTNIASEVRFNERLLEDFPEICYPIMMTEGNSFRAKLQHVHGKLTHISIRVDSLTFPVVENSTVSGSIIRCASIIGRIRGLKHNIPNGNTIRPDLVVIDDPQTDRVAKSLAQVNVRERIINGTVRGLAGPGKPLTILMPCTVIQSNDLAERFLDRNKRPEWRGKRSKLIKEFPKRMDLWNEYWKIKCDSFRNGGRGLEATDFYIANRSDMDEGSNVPWEDRYTKPVQISALQHGMDLYFKDPITFFSEYQNDPIIDSIGVDGGRIDLKPADILKRTSGLDRGVCPRDTLHVTTGIDIQAKILYYLTVAWKDDLGGVIIDYGTFPKQPIDYWNTQSPPIPLDGINKELSFGPLVYAGLESIFTSVLQLKYSIDESEQHTSTQKVMIDANWSLSADAVYSFTKEYERFNIFHPCHGRGITASQLPMSEWIKKHGEKKSDYNWTERLSTNVKNRGRHIIYDSNYWKSIIADRILAPKGSDNALLLYGDDSIRHEFLADQLCAEYPVTTHGRGRSIDEWKAKAGIVENHWFDCLVQAAVGVSILGLNPHNIIETDGDTVKSKQTKIKPRRIASAPPKAKQF